MYNPQTGYNGFTYVITDVVALAAEGEDGVNVNLAQSDMSDGNSPNDRWNSPLDHFYNVKIVDGELVASDELLVTAGEVSEFDFGTFFLKGQPVIDELDEDLWVIPNFRAWIPA